MTTLLTRDAILDASDIKTEDVHVPEWGGTVRVKGLTAAQRDTFESEMVKMRGKNVDLNMAGIRSRLVLLSVVDENGAQVFTPADLRALGEKSARPIDRIFEIASRLSGIGEEDVEELGKLSESDQAEGSPSD